MELRQRVQDWTEKYGPVPVTVIASGVTILASVGIAYLDVIVFSHNLFPAIVLAAVIPTLLAPPMIYTFAKLVTRLAEKDREIRERELKYKTVIESAGDEFFLHSLKGDILEVNHRACENLGYSREELLNLHVTDVETGLPAEGLHDHWNSLVFGEFNTIYGIHTRKDGSTYPVEVRLGPVQFDDESFILALARDITDRQAAEKELRDLQNELAHAGRINAVGELSTGLAHELNQPLAAASNYVQGAVRRLSDVSDTPPEILDALNKAYQQNLRAGEIIRWLRDFVRRDESEKSTTDINAAIGDTEDLILMEARQANIEIVFNLSPELRPARINRVQVQQIILNLVRNGIEAISGNQNGSRVISIQTANLEDDRIKVEVLDSGPGISAETEAHIFDRFYTTKADGLGIGLAICRTIVEAANGGISVVRPDDGLTGFEIVLPTADAAGISIQEQSKATDIKSDQTSV